MRTISEVMNTPIDSMEFSVRCVNGMKCAGVKTLSDVTRKSLDDFSKLRNLGKKSLDEITSRLNDIGLTFCMTDRDWLLWGMEHVKWIKAQ